MRPLDQVVAAYLAIETILILLAGQRLAGWMGYLGAHLLLIALIVLFLRTIGPKSPRPLRILRDWYPGLYIPLVFKQLGALIPAVHQAEYDDLLLSLDRTLFGGHPGAWFDTLATPLLTETLRACWLSYFILPFLLLVPLYRRKEKSAFHETVLALVMGWLLSFLGYYILPALGPGYFPDKIPAPASVGADGVTQSVAQALFSVEGRMHDVFPSGHALVALIVLFQARRHKLKGWPLLIPVVAGLIAGTVYLRYHYGVDVLAGAALAWGTLWIARRWHKKTRPREGPR